ncbi:uncharacterized protein LOC124282866 [Haliotis rubra]|uniref:uncharacterized protein LOC124282866 n=1 Tax=Haliotis rubra TaxID=36100 RepID=UPI001EE5A70E|nr:uncharacterized protein LOC124282866 [Haliotis rubra]
MTSLALLYVVPLLCPFSDSAETNLALNKHAFQSSEYGDSAVDTGAENAVDGNTNGDWYANSCTTTASHDTSTWWFVDLLEAYEVTQVIMWNRVNHSGRLRNLVVEVSSVNPATYPSAYRKLCSRFPGIAGAQENLTCNSPVIGRFVRISKIHVHGTIPFLTLCEVDVRGNLLQIDVTESNVALHKVAYQSSDYPNPDTGAGNAVDGNTDGAIGGNSCTSTADGDMNAWWLVDLLDVYEVTNVTLWNRDIGADRLQNLVLEVRSQLPVVLPIPQAELCTAFPATVGAQVTLPCDAPVIGRFFIVRKVNVSGIDEHLTMCEVAVSGNLIKSDCGSRCLKAEVGKRFMTDNASKFVTVLSPAECACDCHRNIRCLGLNYEMSTGTCEMIYKLKTSVDQLINAPGWKYYGYNIY